MATLDLNHAILLVEARMTLAANERAECGDRRGLIKAQMSALDDILGVLQRAEKGIPVMESIREWDRESGGIIAVPPVEPVPAAPRRQRRRPSPPQQPAQHAPAH